MADKYWVGDSGSFGSSAHWSATSGGSGGVAAPDGFDNAIFDANSFSVPAQTVTLGSITTVLSLDMSSIDQTVVISTVGNSLVVGTGNCTLSDLLTINDSLQSSTLLIVGGIFTQNGAHINSVNTLSLQNASLGGSLVKTAATTKIIGTFNASNFDLTTHDLIFDNSSTVTMGSGTWTTSSLVVGTSVVINSDTSLLLYASGGVFNTGGSNIVFNRLQVDEATLDFSNAGDITVSSFVVQHGSTVIFKSGKTFTTQMLQARGASQSPIVFRASSAGSEAFLSAAAASVGSISVSDNHALGDIPFFDVGGFDGSGNTNWVFSISPASQFQNIQLSFSDTSGDVQLLGAGTSDNEETIYYELETHEIEFGNRATLKYLSDKIGVLGNFGVDSQLQAFEDGEGPKPIPMTIARRINIGKDTNLHGHFFSFKWFGQTSTGSPVFEGIMVEDGQDMGVTYE